MIKVKLLVKGFQAIKICENSWRFLATFMCIFFVIIIYDISAIRPFNPQFCCLYEDHVNTACFVASCIPHVLRSEIFPNVCLGFVGYAGRCPVGYHICPTFAREFQGLRVWGKIVFQAVELTVTRTNLGFYYNIKHHINNVKKCTNLNNLFQHINHPI